MLNVMLTNKNHAQFILSFIYKLARIATAHSRLLLESSYNGINILYALLSIMTVLLEYIDHFVATFQKCMNIVV